MWCAYVHRDISHFRKGIRHDNGVVACIAFAIMVGLFTYRPFALLKNYDSCVDQNDLSSQCAIIDGIDKTVNNIVKLF